MGTKRTKRLTVGQKITHAGYPGRVLSLYSDGPTEDARMYNIRLESGDACVCGSDLQELEEQETRYGKIGTR